MQLEPYLMFNGTCKEAIEFYRDNLEGEIVHMSTYADAPPMGLKDEDKNRVMHALLKFGSVSLMASDCPPSNPVPEVSNVHLSLNFEDVPTMEATYDKLGIGGKQTMPIQDTFWGARFGMLTDKFGINWMFNCDLGDKSTQQQA